MNTTRIPFALIVAAVTGTGCVSFNGPDDVRNLIAAQENVRLEQTTGVTVGPVGVFLASTLAGGYIPVKLDGLSWVSFGEYDVCRLDPSCERFQLRDLEMDGWERIVRICSPDEEVIVMVEADDERLRKLLFVQNEGDVVRLARVEGDLELLIDRILESELIGLEFVAALDGEGDEETGTVSLMLTMGDPPAGECTEDKLR